MKQKKQALTREEFIQRLCDEINDIQEEMDILYQQEPRTKESVIERIREKLKLCAQSSNPFKAAAIIDYVFHSEPVISFEELHVRQNPYEESSYASVEGFEYNDGDPEFVSAFLGAVKVIDFGE